MLNSKAYPSIPMQVAGKFVFSDNIFVNAEGFWRLLKDKSIHAVSLDHGHQFGLPEPVNLTTLVTKELTGKKLTRIHVDKNSGDLTLSLSDNIELHIFTTSTVYETYNFYYWQKNILWNIWRYRLINIGN